MHYDSEKGSKVLDGLFSKRTIIAMIVCLVLLGVYFALTYFAPDIFKKTSAEKYAIDDRALNERPASASSLLLIPSAGIEVQVSEKKSPGNVLLWHNSQDKVKLMAEHKIIGVTPWETLSLSPLYNLNMVSEGDFVYFDTDGVRGAYKVTKTNSESASLPESIVIQSTGDSDKFVASIIAEKVGNLTWKDGKAVVISEE